MKVGSTNLHRINWGLHLGIIIYQIKDKEEAYKIRKIANEIMEEINCIEETVTINENQFPDGLNILIYGVDDFKRKTIIKRLGEMLNCEIHII